MFHKDSDIYAVTYEAFDKEALLEKLEQSGVKLNKYAYEIFQSTLFQPSASDYTAIVTELTLAEIGLKFGGDFEKIRNCIAAFGLSYCPLELVPYIRLRRLHYKDQSEPEEKKWGKAPPNSITIFSKPLLESDDFPKGFYIRTINGTPWLRGYQCSADYVWDSNVRMIFKKDINYPTT